MMFELSKHLKRGERIKIIISRLAVILIIVIIIATGFIMVGRHHYEAKPSCGTGAPSPEEATEDLMRAVSNSDWTTACKYTTSDQNTVRDVFNGVTKTKNHKAKKIGSRNGRTQVTLKGSTSEDGYDDVSWSFWTTRTSNGDGWLVIIDPS